MFATEAGCKMQLAYKRAGAYGLSDEDKRTYFRMRAKISQNWAQASAGAGAAVGTLGGG